MKQMIYADNAATTKLDIEAYEAMKPYLLDNYANASQPYSFSREVKKALKESREIIARCINAEPEEIYFTSGGTESDNWAIKGIAYNDSSRNAIITSNIEHHAVLNSCRQVEKYFKSLLAGSTLDFLINGARDHIPGNVSLSFKYSDGEMLLHRLDLLGIMISTGAACDSKNTRVSHVLQAIKVPEEYAKGTIRLSFGKYNSLKDAEIIANSLLQILS